MAACPGCGADNPSEARFCMSCGTSLASEPAASHEVRKTVTVVFADVVGSTPLGERLDPEALRHVMARYFDRMKTVVEGHGGQVEKFIGDAVMAVFGIPTIHEDDAPRAVRAAAEMREALADLNRDLDRDHGVAIQARIGVNTGEVVSGDPAAGQTLATGDPINTAARLQQAAGSGEILLGFPTYRLVKEAVRVEAVEPLSVKGKEARLVAFRLLEVLPQAEAIPRRFDSPIVGRERELGLLVQSFKAAAGGAGIQLVTVVGAPGVGKSRLAEELISWVGEAAVVLRGRCLAYGEGITYWPLREMVRHAAGVTDADGVADARSKIEALLPEADRATIADPVAAALGLTGEPIPAQETFRSIRRLLESLADRLPVLVVLDDVHWAEPTFLDLVEYLAGFDGERPITIVCLARPELLEGRPLWGSVARSAALIHLQPLSESQIDGLVTNLLGHAEVPEGVRLRILEAAEGNPLFVEEIIRMLVDDGVLRTEGDRWLSEADFRLFSVPATIQALLAARLERLSWEQRALMQRASVVGKTFWWGAVAELSPEATRGEIGSHIQALIRGEMIRPERSEFPDEDAFRFRHILIREGAYESTPKETRAELHARFAAWLERKAGPRVKEYEELLGYHLERAYRYRAELGPVREDGRTLASRAAGYLSSAGSRALAREDIPAAINLLTRAAELIPEDDRARPGVLSELGLALMQSGDFGRSGDILEEAIRAASRCGDRRLEGHTVLVRLFGRIVADPEGVSEEARTTAERSIPDFENQGDHLGLSEAWRLLGEVEFLRGRALEAEQAVQQALQHVRRASGAGRVAYHVGFFAALGAMGPTPVLDAIARCEDCLERVKDYYGVEAWILRHLASLRAMRGDFGEARRLLTRARELHRHFGQLLWQAGGLSQSVGYVEMLAGDLAAAERAWQWGVENLERIGERRHLAWLSGRLAQALAALGRLDEAESHISLSEEAAAHDDVDAQVGWRSAQATVLAARGLLDEAAEVATKAVSLAATTDFLNLRADSLVDLAEVSRQAGQRRNAARAAREALVLYDRKGNLVSAAKARALQEPTD